MAVVSNSDPVRVFIGSSRKNRVEEKVFVRSLRAMARAPLEINILDGDSGEVRWQSGRVEPLPGAGGNAGAVTKFSLARFAIPQLCGFQGRAIYCDSDQLVFADIGEIAGMPLGDAVAAAVRVADAICAEPYRRSVLQPLIASGEDYFLTSVMLIDCARARNWDIASFQRKIQDKSIDYTGLMFFGRRERESLGWRIAALAPVWNSLDHRDQQTRLLHFTDLKSQPWLFPNNPTSPVWEHHLWAALDDGSVDAEDLRLSHGEGGIDARTRWTALLRAPWRAATHGAWTWLGQQLAPAAWLRGLDRRLSAALPDLYWHWKRSQKPQRKLGWWLGLSLERCDRCRRAATCSSSIRRPASGCWRRLPGRWPLTPTPRWWRCWPDPGTSNAACCRGCARPAAALTGWASALCGRRPSRAARSWFSAWITGCTTATTGWASISPMPCAQRVRPRSACSTAGPARTRWPAWPRRPPRPSWSGGAMPSRH
ncbi:MAG: hypothetical protein Q8Q73_16260 [Stagnimonas sp.]|nr:hypothetical protein [Stagnimonas sp.]